VLQSTTSAQAASFDGSQITGISSPVPGAIVAPQADLSGGPPGPTFLVTLDIRAFDAIGQSITTPPAGDYGFVDPGGGFDQAITNTEATEVWLAGAGSGIKFAAGESFAGQQIVDGFAFTINTDSGTFTAGDPLGFATIEDDVTLDRPLDFTVITAPGTYRTNWAAGDTIDITRFAGQGSTAFADMDVTRYSTVGLLLAMLALGITGRFASIWRSLANYMIAFQQTPTPAFAGQEPRRALQNDLGLGIGSTFNTGRRQVERALENVRQLISRLTEADWARDHAKGIQVSALKHDLVADSASQGKRGGP